MFHQFETSLLALSWADFWLRARPHWVRRGMTFPAALFRFENKVALVTGGYGGIGATAADGLAAMGAKRARSIPGSQMSTRALR